MENDQAGENWWTSRARFMKECGSIVNLLGLDKIKRTKKDVYKEDKRSFKLFFKK